MKNRAEQDALLADVLAETVPGEFRTALLETTLDQVRRRRRARVVRRAAGAVLAAIALVTAATWWAKGRGAAERSAEGRCAVVHTQALPAEAIVTTRALEARRVVTSQMFFAVVRTKPAEGVRLIGDAELLALASRRPMVLVRIGPHLQQAVFVEEGGRVERKPE